MKTFFFKINMVAIAVAMAVTACKPAKDNANTGKPDSNKVDSGKTDLTKVDSTKDDTAIKATTSIKNDTVKNNFYSFYS